MRGYPVELPEIGLFIGNGVYPSSAGYQLGALLAHGTWNPYTSDPDEMIERIINENQGNLAQVWGYPRGYAPYTVDKWFYRLEEIGVTIPRPDWENGKYLSKHQIPEWDSYAERLGAGLLRFIEKARERGLYTTFIYTSAHPKWSKQFRQHEPYYLGYDFGERFTFRFESAFKKNVPLQDITLKMLQDDLLERVGAHVKEYEENGWGNVAATSGNFYLDVEVVAGANIPMAEDIAFRHMNIASSLSRGLYRQFELPLWGTHIAHEHYSWIPAKCKYKFPLLRAALYHKYMAGAKMIVNESGNWFVEASLCEDSPKFELPRSPLTRKDVSFGDTGKLDFLPYHKETSKHFDKIGPDSWYCKAYRKEISDFYDYVKANGTPSGQPETTIALAKGHLDLGGYEYRMTAPVGGMYDLAEINPQWMSGPPEYSWDVAFNTFYPRPQGMGDYLNMFLSGTPWGMLDIVSFAEHLVSAEHLIANYKALLFTGWNTASEKQYEVLKQYVQAGGILFLSIPHLSTNDKRNYSSFTVDELVHKGDFSELCGVKVEKRGTRFYWAVPPPGTTQLGSTFPRRWGIMSTCMGKIEITDPNAEVMVVDDEGGEPVLLKRQYGKGTVYFLNSWAYPGAMNSDFGPGARHSSKGLITAIYEEIARQCRGTFWITDDGNEPGKECENICYSYFPESQTLCMQNVDFDRPHTFWLHQAGAQARQVTLEPSEFVMQSVAVPQTV